MGHDIIHVNGSLLYRRYARVMHAVALYLIRGFEGDECKERAHITTVKPCSDGMDVEIRARKL